MIGDFPQDCNIRRVQVLNRDVDVVFHLGLFYCVRHSVKILALVQPQKASETLLFLHRLKDNGFQEEFTELVRLYRLITVDECHDNDRILEALFCEQFVDLGFEEANDAIVFMSFIVFAEELKIVETRKVLSHRKLFVALLKLLTPR